MKRFFILLIISVCSLPTFAQGIEALKEQAVELENQGNKIELASTLNKLAVTYWQQGNLDKAIENFDKSFQLNEELKNTNAQRIIKGYLGLVYLEKEDFDNAISSFSVSLEMNRAAGKTQEVISDQYNIAMAYQSKGDIDNSNAFADNALSKSLETNNLKTTKSCYLILAENADKQGNTKLAADYYDKYNAISKHLQQEQMAQLETESKQIQSRVKQKEAELQVARDTLDAVIEAKNTESEQHKAEVKEIEERNEAQEKLRQTQILYMSIALVMFIVILFLFIVQSRTRKLNNKKLQEQNAEIEKQKQELEEQHALVTKQKKNLTDSIQYAQKIQKAVLPRQEALYEHFSDSFIFHRPRDIVSGDFYWYVQKDDLFIIAAADCTGHGVPGAFMSMLGVAFLNEIVNKIAVNVHINSLNADEILNQLREKIIKSLHQSNNKRDLKDGMDIALCIVDFSKKKLQYAGAYNPLIIIRDGEVIRHNADKMPVSFHRRMKDSFTRKEVDLQENDCIYLFSDGFVDQFGGEGGMKYLMKNFLNLLLEIHSEPMNEQSEILANKFDEWRGSYSQIDDVLVIGLRFAPVKKESIRNWENKTILIAEDTDMNYFLLAEVLKKTKATLIRVKNGQEAIDIVKSNHVDLVLMDINMPVLDGYAATLQIKEFRPDIPVIIQTAVFEDGKAKSLEVGADDFIAKPIDLKTFMSKLIRFLD